MSGTGPGEDRRVWVKICGNTSIEDALLAADAGADAVGFVFAPSPRRVTVEQVAGMVAHLPARIEKIGVFVDADLDEICAAVRASGLTGVQLHSDAAADLPERIHAELGAGIGVLRVVHFGAGPAAQRAAAQAEVYGADPHVDAVLVDSWTATAVGGTGVRFDWDAARESLFGGPDGKLIVAGGLTAENVAKAIATLRPFGVDVVSGVEAAPGKKDPEKVRAFVQRVRGIGVGDL